MVLILPRSCCPPSCSSPLCVHQLKRGGTGQQRGSILLSIICEERCSRASPGLVLNPSCSRSADGALNRIRRQEEITWTVSVLVLLPDKNSVSQTISIIYQFRFKVVLIRTWFIPELHIQKQKMQDHRECQQLTGRLLFFLIIKRSLFDTASTCIFWSVELNKKGEKSYLSRTHW